MRTKIRVVDVTRFDHFDLNMKSYPEKSKYFLYGSKDKAYISHIPVMKPDFLQVSRSKLLYKISGRHNYQKNGEILAPGTSAFSASV